MSLACAMFVVSPVHGEVDVGQAKAALIEAVKSSLDPTPLMGFRFEWTEETDTRLLDAEYSDLAAVVNGRKDHPQYGVFRDAQWDRTKGPRTTHHQLWSIAPRYWRHCLTFTSGGPDAIKGAFSDHAWGPDAGWMAAPIIVAVTNPDDEKGVQFMQPAMNGWLDSLQYFTTGGLHAVYRVPGGEPDATIEQLPDGGFSGQVWRRPDLKWFVKFRAELDGRVKIGELRPPQQSGQSSDDWLGKATIRFDDWGVIDGCPLTIARTVTREVPGRRITLRMTSIETTDRETVATLLSIPSATNEDPIRGRFVPGAVTDFRTKITSVMNQDGTVKNAQPAPESRSTPQTTPRWAGWVISACVLSFVVGVLVVRKYRGS